MVISQYNRQGDKRGRKGAVELADQSGRAGLIRGFVHEDDPE